MIVKLVDGVKLKACPFCGGDANLRTQPSQYGISAVYWVKCDGCDVSPRADNDQLKVIERWNKRAT